MNIMKNVINMWFLCYISIKNKGGVLNIFGESFFVGFFFKMKLCLYLKESEVILGVGL